MDKATYNQRAGAHNARVHQEHGEHMQARRKQLRGTTAEALVQIALGFKKHEATHFKRMTKKAIVEYIVDQEYGILPLR